MTLTRRKALLESIGSTEASTFNEFLWALGDDSPSEPRRGSPRASAAAGRSEWAILFRDLKELEDEEVIEVDRIQGKISGLILTAQGVRALTELRRRG